MINETFIEIEQAAKALDLGDVHTGAVCLRKALEGHVAMGAPSPSPPANAVSPLAELSKAINALEIQEFSLAALCAEKAAKSLESRLPELAHVGLLEAARAVRQKSFTSAANGLRKIVRHYRPSLTLPAADSRPKAADSRLNWVREPEVSVLVMPRF